MPVNTRIQFRRGTAGAGANQWTNQILYAGEVGYETDTGRFKIGDGSTAWSSLAYAAVLPSSFTAGSGIAISQGTNGSTLTISLSDPTIQASDVTDFSEAVDDRVASLLNGGSGVVFNYVDGSDRLDVGLDSTVIRTTGTQTIGGSKTFGAPTTFSSGISMSDQTASRIAGFDASKNITSLDTTTYPSLTELSYVKNVTSSIQTQLGNKVNNTTTLTPGSGLAGSSALDLSANRTFDVGQGDGILVSADSVSVDSTVVRTTGTQTVGGIKTFSSTPVFSNGATVTGNLTVSGSGLVASNINDFNTAVRTNRLDQLAVPTADVSLNSNKITNLATPTNPSDAATKAYVDASRLGLDVKDSVRVATTANITLSGTQTIDGVSVVAGDRVLVKDQSTGSQNGIYVVAAGAWSRATDADVDAEVTAGMFTFVSEGSTNADSGWVLTTNDTITLGTTALTFAQFSGAGQITAGAGLTKTGNTVDVGTASSSRIVVNADSIDLATVSQSNSSGSAGSSFVQSVGVDSYGRVSGVVTASVQDATTSAKGIASFDSNTFSLTNGAVSVKNSGITNSQLVYDYITLGSVTQTLGSSYNTLAGLSAISGTSAGSPTTLTFCVIDGGTP